nr:hypothetical protein Iba_chr07cCG0020 [Ipomoea batatas]GMD15465.1 hypothetical protein Iba_chr07cCG0030 [Ipomoea batatas]GMD87902.1 hypothetical protein Iba_chr14cCG1860 [Ipomoea batatas]GME07814.1 hypothetical protein Iba_scaffold6541CG0030 [Ipomoea batatas]GME07815.1 hypothetical protein Iba_scaffold6541CG0040 [Ipomoea batatas]
MKLEGMPLTRAVFRITGERKRPGADLPLCVGLAIGLVARSCNSAGLGVAPLLRESPPFSYGATRPERAS